jgi:hypothetical protein
MSPEKRTHAIADEVAPYGIAVWITCVPVRYERMFGPC